MVVSTACAECERYYEKQGRRDGGCREGCTRNWNSPAADAEFGSVLDSFGFRAEEVKPDTPKT